jgi:hypothetical protein
MPLARIVYQSASRLNTVDRRQRYSVLICGGAPAMEIQAPSRQNHQLADRVIFREERVS